MFSNRLKEARKRFHHTQESLAELLGVDTITVSKWERGVMQPALENIQRIAQALETSSDYLLGLSNDPSDERNLNETEEAALSAWRRGDKMTAVKIILGD